MKVLVCMSILLLFPIVITAQELTVFCGLWNDGFYIDANQINKKGAKRLLMDYQPSGIYWKKKITNKPLFYVSFAAQTVSTGCTLNELANDSGNAIPRFTLGTVGIGSTFLDKIAKNAIST